MARRLIRGAGIVSALCWSVIAMNATALAQDATPVGSALACVDVATPAVDAVLAESHSSGAVPGTAVAETPVALGDLPQGEPADAETLAMADSVVSTWMACQLSGEALAVLALQSDQMDAAFAGQYGQDPVAYENMLNQDLQASPVPIDSAIVLAPGAEVRELDDGRIGGIWSLNGDAAFIILVQEDGNWVVDEVVDIVEEGTPTP